MRPFFTISANYLQISHLELEGFFLNNFGRTLRELYNYFKNRLLFYINMY